MIGITAFGTYVPVYRLGRSEIARAWKTNDLGGERTVAKHDEDSLTMAVAATLECIKRTPKGADALFFASTTPPYREKQAATIVAAATDLPMNSRTSDITDSIRAGTIAIGLAADTVKSGSHEEVIVVASDCSIWVMRYRAGCRRRETEGHGMDWRATRKCRRSVDNGHCWH